MYSLKKSSVGAARLRAGATRGTKALRIRARIAIEAKLRCMGIGKAVGTGGRPPGCSRIAARAAGETVDVGSHNSGNRHCLNGLFGKRRMKRSAPPPTAAHWPGLCSTCRHGRPIANARGSTFWRCELSETDARFPRYPRLPVLTCEGFAPTEPEST